MKAKGFTLIELIVVIVILGILSATALPKFVNFKSDAALAAAQAVAGALGSATSMNFAKYQISPGAAATYYSPVTTGVACTTLISSLSLMAAAPPTGMTGTNVLGCAGPGTVGTCSLNNSANGATQSATVSVTCLN